MTMGYACRASGVSPQTIRLYEKEGLIQPERASSGVRIFRAADIDRIRAIRESRRAGRPRKAPS
ncbi:MAG: MerR family transcriptional regulator [Gammaproteobacteria bacterium]